eukprot:352775-Chlamydomonas_euryale.AAC.3
MEPTAAAARPYASPCTPISTRPQPLPPHICRQTFAVTCQLDKIKHSLASETISSPPFPHQFTPPFRGGAHLLWLAFIAAGYLAHLASSLPPPLCSLCPVDGIELVQDGEHDRLPHDRRDLKAHVDTGPQPVEPLNHDLVERHARQLRNWAGLSAEELHERLNVQRHAARLLHHRAHVVGRVVGLATDGLWGGGRAGGRVS